MANVNRPLSPHLQIYRWYLAMALSIAHRASGIILTLGLFFLTWWLVALASGEQAFSSVDSLTDSWIGGLALFGWTFAIFYHLCNGIRHLVWDVGFGFEKRQAFESGLAVLAISCALTLITWIAVL
ncbi:MAG: succinate dehydrogenase, cytochrome b556 subunit, partial [Pseudomonadota bacterium]